MMYVIVRAPLKKLWGIFCEKRRSDNHICDAALLKQLNFFVGLLILFPSVGFTRDLTTNNIRFSEAPDWLNTAMVDEVVQRVQGVLEWDIRQIAARYHKSKESFSTQHGLNFEAAALFHRPSQTIHLSPLVSKDNFSAIFGHELTHAISWQKYKEAIPTWLEEGLANYVGKKSSPGYRWLATQTHSDVTSLSHPAKDGSKYHYAASTALIEMIASKCSLKDLLQLSVGRRMESYLKTYCEISDLNAQFRVWVNEQSKNPSGERSEAHLPWWKRKKYKK